MKINSKRQERNYIIVALCAVLVIMGVGYAAFSQLLTINGTANISNSWCVGFDNTKTNAYTPKAGITGATAPTGSMSYSGTACESTLQPASSLTAHFYQPGDEIEYTLTIVNKSSVTAAIKSILVDNESVTSNTTKTKNNITYIVNMPESTALAPNASTTMKIIARFQNETDVIGNVNGQTETIEVKINTEQDDGNGGMVVTGPFTGAIYRWSTTPLVNKDSSQASSYPYTIENLTKGTDYITEEDYPTYSQRTTALGKQYYLKHDVVDDEITASYVCFIYNNAEHCMKGGDNGASFAANTQTIQDYQTFYNLNTVSNPSSSNPGCDFYSTGSYCDGGGFDRVYANSFGHVYVRGSSSEYCTVNFVGNSRCYE